MQDEQQELKKEAVAHVLNLCFVSCDMATGLMSYQAEHCIDGCAG